MINVGGGVRGGGGLINVCVCMCVRACVCVWAYEGRGCEGAESGGGVGARGCKGPHEKPAATPAGAQAITSRSSVTTGRAGYQ